MITIKIYEYWDSEQKKTVRNRIPKDELTNLKLFTLIAETGNYLYHKETEAIRASVTVPDYMAEDWEERAY